MTTTTSQSFYVRAGKRCFDAISALAGIVLLAPVLLVLSLLVLLTSGWPILFRQQRTGRNAQPFSIWKFRTMTNATAPGAALVTASGDSRITPFGAWLRRTKVDELPQLFNVLRGDMSLVGPRPEVPFYTADYTPRQRAVLQVRPGVTGPAAHQYLHEEELLARAESDLGYIQAIAFNTDLKLIANTVIRLLFKSPDHSKLTSGAPQRQA
jgi:lipopolysaccharide/colanic/teichoic acid biosynthesis glycosyltransferase